MNGRPRQVPVAGNGSLSVSFSTNKSLKCYCVYVKPISVSDSFEKALYWWLKCWKSYSVRGDSAVLVLGTPLHYSYVKSYLSDITKQFGRHDLKVQVIQKSFKISYIKVENPGHSTWVGVLNYFISPVTPKYTGKSVYLQLPSRIVIFDLLAQKTPA